MAENEQLYPYDPWLPIATWQKRQERTGMHLQCEQNEAYLNIFHIVGDIFIIITLTLCPSIKLP